MTTQSEQILEDNLIKQLTSFEKYSYVQISDEKALIANLKAQLEKHNNITLSETEFTKVLNHLSKGNVFDKSKTLRDRMQLTRDNGESIYIEFIQQDHWCQLQIRSRWKVVTRIVTM